MTAAMDAARDEVAIRLGDRSYRILIGSGLLGDPASYADLDGAADAMIVSNARVGALYADALVAALGQKFERIHRVELPDGEQYKNWETLNLIFDALLSAACDRKTVLFALGGGVVGDMTGFAAACYMRGVPFVQVPTTLLAQVDSSVGGKTGINHPLGKNMVGAFHQPLLVVADTATLASLPARELAAGLAEVIKYGPIADSAFLDWVDAHLPELLAREPAALAHAVKRSCEIKAEVVAGDEREGGVRAILNFGHTFGHAIEAGVGYGEWLHGEAVGCGMVLAVELSRRLGLVDAGYGQRLRDLIARAGLPIRAPALGVERYLQLMRQDKKAEGGALRFVVIEAPGRAKLCRVDEGLVREVLRAGAA